MSGASLADTVGAAPDSLVVTYYNDYGYPMANTPLWFFAALTEDGRPTVVFKVPPPVYWTDVVEARTDSNGRLAMHYRLGKVAGQGAIAVGTVSNQLVEVAEYTIRPGAAVKVELEPRDTAVFLGNSAAIRGRVLDAHGNVRPELPTFAVDSTPANVTDQGVVTPGAFGNVRVIGAGGQGADTAWVRSLPQAAFVVANHRGGGVFTINADGSRHNLLAYDGAAVDWSPDGETVVLRREVPGSYDLGLLSLSGEERMLLQGSTAGFAPSQPRFSPDGEWVYLVGYVYGLPQRIYRIRPDGSDLQRVTPDHAPSETAHSLSRDGRFLAVQSGDQIVIRDLSSQDGLPLPHRGSRPVWSPVSDHIAYLGLNGAIWITAPGGESRQLTPWGYTMTDIAWSPDGRWILTSYQLSEIVQQVVVMVDVETGHMIRVPNIEGEIAWRPGPVFP